MLRKAFLINEDWMKTFGYEGMDNRVAVRRFDLNSRTVLVDNPADPKFGKQLTISIDRGRFVQVGL